MILVYKNRMTKSAIPQWAVFAYSLLATEFAWLWLPLQMTIAYILVLVGALNTGIGKFALAVLAVSWLGLIYNIFNAFKARGIVQKALNISLGIKFLEKLTPTQRNRINQKISFKDWALPFNFKRKNVEVIRDIPYGSHGVRQMLDVYRPTNIPPEGCPVLLQIHGGAWMIGNKEHQALPLLNLMASKGWICISINYRLSPSIGFPTHLEDCKRALNWIKTSGVEYGIDPNFISVTGGSAGGHLAALMGLTANYADLQHEFPELDTQLQACVPLYGVYDVLVRKTPNKQKMMINFLKNRVIHQTPEQAPELWDLASPICHIKEQAPPFMIIQGGIDSLTAVKGAQEFQSLLAEKSKNEVVYVELPGAEHAFDNFHSPRTEAVINGIHQFLEYCYAKHKKESMQ